MKEYLTAGILVIVIALTGFLYTAVNVSLIGERTYVSKEQVVGYLLQCAASLFCGVLGGYLLGVHRERQKSLRLVRGQDSSAQE